MIDTRPLFKRGYRPTTVAVSFPSHPRLNRTVDVDPLTNIATVVFENDSLTAAELTALGKPVDVKIVVTGDDASAAIAPALRAASRGPALSLVLSETTGLRSIDPSNRPVDIDNQALVAVVPPIVLEPNTPYVLAMEGLEKVPAVDDCVDCIYWYRYPYFRGPVLADTTPEGRPRRRQGFLFSPVAGTADTYTIENYARSTEGTFLVEKPYSGGGFILGMAGGTAPLPATGRTQFVVESDSTRAVRIRVAGTQRYVAPPSAEFGFWTTGAVGARVYLMAIETEWAVSQLGTAFNQPIVPPAEIAFASQSTIRNCSAATVNETLGRTQSRTTSRSYSLSESFQTVSEKSSSYVHAAHIDIELKWEPGDGGGFGAGANFGWSEEWSDSYSTTSMHDRTTVRGADTSETVEVTRSRDVTVPPYSAVTAVDWVRTIRNVTVPWTQRYRFEGRNPVTGLMLSGAEIVSQMRFNRLGGVITDVGPDFIEFTLRGRTTVDDFYQSESVVRDIPNACR